MGIRVLAPALTLALVLVACGSGGSPSEPYNPYAPQATPQTQTKETERKEYPASNPTPSPEKSPAYDYGY